MRLRHDLVIVKGIELDETEKGGLIIPPSAENSLLFGEITHLGDEVTDIKVGETVLFRETAGEEISLNGVFCRIMIERDVMAVL